MRIDEQPRAPAVDAGPEGCGFAVDAHLLAQLRWLLFNGRHARTGTLREGRYKACLVDSRVCFPACSRHVELKPVRAWMVPHPGDYPRSSYGANRGGAADQLLPPHPEYLALGRDAPARSTACRALFADATPDDLVEEIRC